eukprot:g18370.t1
MTLARRMRPFRAPWHVSGGGGQAARWRSGHGRRSRLEALEALVELDGLLEDELIEKDEAGVASREELHSERQVDAVAEELPVDELIEEEAGLFVSLATLRWPRAAALRACSTCSRNWRSPATDQFEVCKNGEEITQELVNELTLPEKVDDSEMMIPVDMRGVGEEGHFRGERPPKMTAADWKKVLDEEKFLEDGEEELMDLEGEEEEPMKGQSLGRPRELLEDEAEGAEDDGEVQEPDAKKAKTEPPAILASKVLTETTMSPSYPGMPSVYRTHMVSWEIEPRRLDALRESGLVFPESDSSPTSSPGSAGTPALPFNSHFATNKNGTKKQFFWRWVPFFEAQKLQRFVNLGEARGLRCGRGVAAGGERVIVGL